MKQKFRIIFNLFKELGILLGNLISTVFLMFFYFTIFVFFALFFKFLIRPTKKYSYSNFKDIQNQFQELKDFVKEF